MVDAVVCMDCDYRVGGSNLQATFFKHDVFNELIFFKQFKEN